MWILHGGPGASATEQDPRLAYGIPAERPDIQYYLVDHRGIGGSGKLECPEAESADSPGGPNIEPDEWPACVDYLRASVGEVRFVMQAGRVIRHDEPR